VSAAASHIWFAATGAWHPILGDDHRGHPQPADAPIPADQVSTLAVLRRPQTDRDRGHDVQAILSLLVRGEIKGLHTDGIRALRRHAYGATILVPAERVGRHDPGYPGGVRRQMLCVFSGVRTVPVTATVIRANGRPRTIHTGGGFSAGEVCGDLKQLRTSGIQETGTRMAHGFLIGGLVPDGVARVIVRLRRSRVVSAVYATTSTSSPLPAIWRPAAPCVGSIGTATRSTPAPDSGQTNATQRPFAQARHARSVIRGVATGGATPAPPASARYCDETGLNWSLSPGFAVVAR
jgi:hypothetical protein